MQVQGEEGKPAEAARKNAADLLTETMYAILSRQARGLRRNRSDTPTLCTAAIVHEAYLRLASSPGGAWTSKEHFLCSAAKAMRCVVIDHVRRRMASKRGSGRVPLPLRESILHFTRPDLDLMALDAALSRLEALDGRKARVVELLFWAGLSPPEAAAALGVSESTVHRDWSFARAWLLREMERPRPPEPAGGGAAREPA